MVLGKKRVRTPTKVVFGFFSVCSRDIRPGAWGVHEERGVCVGADAWAAEA